MAEPQPATVLDWHTHPVAGPWTPPAPCRICDQPALLRNEQGRPCHKVCAEGNTQQRSTPVPRPAVAEQPTTAGSICCGTGPGRTPDQPTVPACALCPTSPTYWRMSPTGAAQ